MYPLLLRLAWSLIAAALILTGCRTTQDNPSTQLPSDPILALQEISNTAQEIQSTHFILDAAMDMRAEGLEVTMTMAGRGDIELSGPSPQDANMQLELTVSMLGQEAKMEMVALNGEFWLQQSGQGWQRLPAEPVNVTGGIGADPATTLGYLERAKEVKRLQDTKIDGVDTYHLGFTMDADVLRSSELLGQVMGGGQLTEAQAQDLLDSAVLEGEVWADKADLLPRRETIEMTFQVGGLPGLDDAPVNYKILIDIGFSKINEPVAINAPAD